LETPKLCTTMTTAAERSTVIEPATNEPVAEPLRDRTTALFHEHGRFVWRVLRRLGVADADVEDVCQDVFLTAHRRIGDFEERSTSRTWLYGICLRVAANYRRRAYRTRERSIDTLSHEPASRSVPEEIGVAALDRALGQLSEVKRVVFVLYEFGELSMAEVAEVVGSPVKTCFSRLHAARRELREVLCPTEEAVR
jgi:RNA polymerase sigma-70 factor (ECF subfamily)